MKNGRADRRTAGKRARLGALVLLAGFALTSPASAQPGDDLVGYSFRRIQVTSGSRIPDTLADRVRDALAARLVPEPGIPATVGVKIVETREAPDGLHLWAIVSVTVTSTGRLLTEFDAEATTPPAPAEREALQAEALADSIASLLTHR
jgi:hypothetical protein